jgi:hypothetical protein
MLENIELVLILEKLGYDYDYNNLYDHNNQLCLFVMNCDDLEDAIISYLIANSLATCQEIYNLD